MSDRRPTLPRLSLAWLLAVLATLPLVLAPPAVADDEPAEVRRPSQLREFARAGTEGTMVVLQRGRLDRLVVVGVRRSHRRFLPSSTFKIPNALIALERGVVRGPDEIFPGPNPNYLLDGAPLLPTACEGDVTFRTALALSCIPIFQRLARQVGRPAYRRALREFDYGNRRISDVAVDDFWLHGPFGISAREQVAFLERLRTGRLPVSVRTRRAVREMLVVERRPGFTLRGKTGFVFAQDGKPQRGWWVGWVQRRGQSSVFALNMDMERTELVAQRVAIGRRILTRLHAFAP